MNRNNLIQAHPYSPHPENQINQMNQWFRQTPTSKYQHTGKVNSIDNQRVTPKNTKSTDNGAGTQPLRLSLRSRSLPRSYKHSHLPENANIPEK